MEAAMIFQNEIWLITLLGLAAVTLGFLFVIAKAGKPADSQQTQRTQKRFYVIRRLLFLALVMLGIGVAWHTLKPFPIPNQHEPLQATQVVKAVAHQWAWQLSRKQIEVGVPVEFQVTSTDVNHGFAIYAPDDRIVIQTQAMPGFTNKMLYTFHQPGTYRILCLEYCGLGHHTMMTELEVVATAKGGQT